MKGFDAAREVGSLSARIRAAGLGFVARYYSYNAAKNLTPAEAKALSAAGIAIVSVWEARGDVAASFTAEQGAKDAAEALRLARAIGQPEGSAIYFAVDFDAAPGGVAGGISRYFRSAGAALGGHYRVGVYGSGLVCQILHASGLAELIWLACAGGWRGTRGFAGWHIKQGLPADPWGFGFQVDPDEAAAGDFGQWSLIAAAPPAEQEPAAQPPGEPIDLVALQQDVQRGLATAGLYDGAIDGDPGPLTRTALAHWRAAQAGRDGQ